VDATYFKVRQGAQYKTRALLIVAGIREDGLREILGASIAESEDSGFWSALFRSLKDRGLDGVEMVISDAHKGIQKANMLKVFLEVAEEGGCIASSPVRL